MSTQINQYLAYGIRLPYDWHKEWEEAHDGQEFCEAFDEFMDDSAFNKEVNHKDGIFCLFDGRDGRFIIIGRMLAKSRDGDFLGGGEPLTEPKLTSLEKELLRDSVKRNFDLEGEWRTWFVTMYR